ncbi:hypothetical protein BAE44_0008527, partial [Dichanthelium oligosanthes]
LGARRRHDTGAGAGLQLCPVRRELGRWRGGPHALLRSRVPPLREREVQERHRRLAPREPYGLPCLPQGRSPRAMKGTTDIGTAQARTTTTTEILSAPASCGLHLVAPAVPNVLLFPSSDPSLCAYPRLLLAFRRPAAAAADPQGPCSRRRSRSRRGRAPRRARRRASAARKSGGRATAEKSGVSVVFTRGG